MAAKENTENDYAVKKVKWWHKNDIKITLASWLI